MGLESDSRSFKASRKPCSSTRVLLISNNFATHIAAVLRTYGSSSFKHFLNGSQRYSVIFFNSDASHSSHCERPYKRIGIITILNKGVDSHDSHVRL